MARFKIVRNLAPEKLIELLPKGKGYRKKCFAIPIISEPIDVVLFTHSFQGQHAIRSAELKKMLEKESLPEARKLIVLAYNFSRECLDILRDIGALAIGTSDYEWTDESILNIRIESGSRVKCPLITKKIRQGPGPDEPKPTPGHEVNEKGYFYPGD